MNILTFDIEEWYNEKVIHGGREFKYKQFDGMLSRLLDELDGLNLKGTFFCLGKLASEYPYVVKEIDKRGHEIGCHSNEHTWLNRMTPDELKEDTSSAVKALEDLIGRKVVSYRAPAFTIGESNKWAIEILAECGIENDASIFPVARDFGGFDGFGLDNPCIVTYNGSSLREFPICVTKVLGKDLAFSGGGYFRVLPYRTITRPIAKRDYTIWYFHLNDLISEEKKMVSKEQYESYYKEPGTFKNRLVRHIKTVIGSSGAYDKMVKVISSFDFTNVESAVKAIDWNNVKTVSL